LDRVVGWCKKEGLYLCLVTAGPVPDIGQSC
jgi:hypothetical protein